MEALFILIPIVVLGLAVNLWGADTRDGRDWQPKPEYWAFPHRERLPRPAPREISQGVMKEAPASATTTTPALTSESCAPAA